MENSIKKIFYGLLITVALAALGYGGYIVYNIIVKDITQKVRKGVRKGIGDAVNPLNLPKNLFGIGSKK